MSATITTQSINTVTLSGHLGRDPEMFYTNAGKACTKFSLAVDSYEVNGIKQDPYWFNVTVWGELAESVAENVKKGNFVVVKGSVRVSKFKSKRMIDQLLALGVKREDAEEIAIATWYEISAYAVASPNATPKIPKEEIPILDLEGGPF